MICGYTWRWSWCLCCTSPPTSTLNAMYVWVWVGRVGREGRNDRGGISMHALPCNAITICTSHFWYEFTSHSDMNSILWGGGTQSHVRNWVWCPIYWYICADMFCCACFEHLCMCTHSSLNSVAPSSISLSNVCVLPPSSLSHSLHCVYFPLQLQTSIVKSNPRSSAVASADVKFLLIPVAFMLLRIGSIVVVIVFIYADADPGEGISYFLLCVAVSQMELLYH